MTDSNDLGFYRTTSTVGVYSDQSGWRDPGEEHSLQAAAPRIRNGKLLDVGVGGGRTTALLRLLSDTYTGIDYSAEMVNACRLRYPGLDIREGDARRLDGFGDGVFDFVYFSFNGIDTLDRDGRIGFLEAGRRVLKPGGLLLFSTLNMHGRTYKETPLQRHRPGEAWDRSLSAASNLVWRNAQDPVRLARRCRNWLASRESVETHEDWATEALAAFNFALVNHFTTLPRLRADLSDAGFDVVAVYGSDQRTEPPIDPECLSTNDDSFYALAEKRL